MFSMARYSTWAVFKSSWKRKSLFCMIRACRRWMTLWFSEQMKADNYCQIKTKPNWEKCSVWCWRAGEKTTVSKGTEGAAEWLLPEGWIGRRGEGGGESAQRGRCMFHGVGLQTLSDPVCLCGFFPRHSTAQHRSVIVVSRVTFTCVRSPWPLDLQPSLQAMQPFHSGRLQHQN